MFKTLPLVINQVRTYYPLLYNLHWLPVSVPIQYTIILLPPADKCFAVKLLGIFVALFGFAVMSVCVYICTVYFHINL